MTEAANVALAGKKFGLLSSSEKMASFLLHVLVPHDLSWLNLYLLRIVSNWSCPGSNMVTVFVGVVIWLYFSY